ncbi:MAG: lipoyl(octanoyl) transferase LipB [Phycisphaerales bacterium]
MASPPECVVEDLGRLAYAPALALQRARHADAVARRGDGPGCTLLLVEHDPPVVTLTRRAGVRDHLLVSEAALAQAGIELHETDRGGDITYHGPGQLVAYPIVDLQRAGLGIHAYIRALEEAIIRTCADFGVACHREEGATGVWTGGPGASARKIAAIGVRVSRWVTMHGLALNVDPRLEHFATIVPCGLAGRPVTSLAQERGGRAPALAEVKKALAQRLQEALGEASASAAARLTRP